MWDSLKLNLNELFHLSLLLSNESTTNVRIPLIRIGLLCKYLKDEKEEPNIKKVLSAKALYDLIEHYKKAGINGNFQLMNRFDQMENLCKKKFEEINKINIFNEEMNFDLKKNKIGQIYLRIITYILEKKNFDNDEEYKIIKKAANDLQSIKINEKMLDELKKFLWETKDETGKSLDELYKMSETKDLTCEKKIHFNYFLFQITKETLFEGNLIKKIRNENYEALFFTKFLKQDAITELKEMLDDLYSYIHSEDESNNRVHDSQTTTCRSQKRKFFRDKYVSIGFFSIIIINIEYYRQELFYVNNKNKLISLGNKSKILELKKQNKYLGISIDYLEKIFFDFYEFFNQYKFKNKIKIDLIFFYQSESGFSDLCCQYRWKNESVIDNDILNNNIQNHEYFFRYKYNDFLKKIKNHILSYNCLNNNSLLNDSNSYPIRYTEELFKHYDNFYEDIKNENIEEIKRIYLLLGKNYSESEIRLIYNNINFVYFLNHDFYKIILYILNESKYTIEIVKNETKNRYEYIYSKIRYKNINNTYEKIYYRVFQELVDLVVTNGIFDCFTNLVNSLNELEKNFKIRLQEFIQLNLTIEVEFKDGIFNPSFKYKFLYKLSSQTITYESLFSSISSKDNEDNFDCLINHIKAYKAYKDSSSPELDPASITHDELEDSDLYKNLDGI